MRDLNRSLRTLEAGQFPGEGDDGLGPRVDAYVMRECAEVDEVLALMPGGKPISESLDGTGGFLTTPASVRRRVRAGSDAASM